MELWVRQIHNRHNFGTERRYIIEKTQSIGARRLACGPPTATATTSERSLRAGPTRRPARRWPSQDWPPWVTTGTRSDRSKRPPRPRFRADEPRPRGAEFRLGPGRARVSAREHPRSARCRAPPRCGPAERAGTASNNRAHARPDEPEKWLQTQSTYDIWVPAAVGVIFPLPPVVVTRGRGRFDPRERMPMIGGATFE